MDDELRKAIELLEHLGGDIRRLAELDEPTRIRLVSAAGQLSRPDRYMRKNLGKVLMRNRANAKRDADRAVLDQTGIRALRREPVFRTPLPRPVDMELDAPIRDDEGPEDAWAAAEATREDGKAPPTTQKAQSCYVCKNEYHELHHFYDQMCPPCAELNFRKREELADLRGRTYLVTGARVKIGYQAAIKLLRCGAEVVVLTRFARDAARRFSREVDASDYAGRLHVYGLDLRHTPSVEQLCRHLLGSLDRLDGIINNACQTVRRPSGWYDHVVDGEGEPMSQIEAQIIDRNRVLGSGDGALTTDGLWKNVVLAQVPLVAEDHDASGAMFPKHRLDQDLQQVDLRESNSWRMTLADVPTAELLEVHLVNAVAPFVLNARLRPLLAAVPTRDAHVVNVSAMEGQFYRRWKTDKHPHTNMAKAALNMMTRTSAAEYVKDGIYMNSVDTGWVTDEDPIGHAERKKREHDFHPPLDIVDGAARIVDPIIDGVNTGNHLWGLFLKDYKPAPW